MKYIAIEGIDGSGKTTLFNSLLTYLIEAGEKVLPIKEPYFDDTRSFANKIRNWNREERDLMLANIFATDRLYLQSQIRQASKDGCLILSDRSKYSSYAYQGQENLSYNMALNHKSYDPNIIIYMDISIKEALKRKEVSDSFESEKSLVEARNVYENRLMSYWTRNNYKTYVIDGHESKEAILNQVIETIYMEVI